MKIVCKFGFTAADALLLLRDAQQVRIFVGEDDNRFILRVSKASIAKDLKLSSPQQPRLCYLEVDRKELIFGSFRAKFHADRVKAAGRYPAVKA